MEKLTILLRESYMKNNVIKLYASFSEIIHIVSKHIQCSRYEQMILKLAKAYEGYQFYLPAFLDFRGRIYRSRVLHFHEHDLARSLVLFAEDKSKYLDNKEISNIYAATGFLYKSFVSEDEAIQVINHLSSNTNPMDLLKLAYKAKRSFQFLANILSNKIDLANYPLTQDASASAYQIMSYFLLDESMAIRTNLIPHPFGEIQDVDSYMLKDLQEYIKAELGDSNLSHTVNDKLTRKIAKGIFMPIIYGKALMSIACDLKNSLSNVITSKECFMVASICFKFWKAKYPHMECLIRLIHHIGWIASASDRPVYYKAYNFTTIQNYTKMEPIKIWVYDKKNKRRRRVTLRVSSDKKDTRKTETSTFVNFIHQRDAHIAMAVVNTILRVDGPIYTVHENFITTAKYSKLAPKIYSSTICEMVPPLFIINEFIRLFSKLRQNRYI
ncbi:probable DNA-directed RNA polymerase [Primulina huaijiensis]|uniref:probable DNA-directed RNA polymerase n=1 Tax=Primulina huaijiensis TaxID=1492673 RepID=UPI003CC75D7B